MWMVVSFLIAALAVIFAVQNGAPATYMDASMCAR